MFFCDNKELNWEILTRNLVTFKRWDWVKDEKFYYVGSMKNSIFMGGGRVHRLKRGTWTVCRF